MSIKVGSAQVVTTSSDLASSEANTTPGLGEATTSGVGRAVKLGTAEGPGQLCLKRLLGADRHTSHQERSEACSQDLKRKLAGSGR